MSRDWFERDCLVHHLTPAAQGHGDYRIVLAHLLFCNLLVLADNERLRGPKAYLLRVDTALRMAVSALEAGV